MWRPQSVMDCVAPEPKRLPHGIVSTTPAWGELCSKQGVPHIVAHVRAGPWRLVRMGLTSSLRALLKALSIERKQGR